MRNFFVMLGLSASLVVACSQNSPSGDASNDAGTDTSMSDGTVAPDVGTDVPTATDVPVDALTVRYGNCGRTIYNCLCACPDNDAGAQCQANCIGTGTCHTCYLDAIMACCPTQYAADDACITAAVSPLDDGGAAPCGSTDFACIESMCMTTDDALNTCTMSAACTTGIAVCLGTFPATCSM